MLREILFSCYTSLSFAEYSVVTYADLKPIKLADGKVYQLLCNERTKTGVRYKIPVVSENVKKLLGHGESFQKIFQPLSNQPTNRYIGVRDGIAERIMGHAEGNDIKDIYTHLHDDDIVKEMVEKWNS